MFSTLIPCLDVKIYTKCLSAIIMLFIFDYKLKWLDADIEMAEKNTRESLTPKANTATAKRGMGLPFRPLSLAFDHVNYYINMPTVNSKHSSLITSNCYSLQHCFSPTYDV